MYMSIIYYEVEGIMKILGEEGIKLGKGGEVEWRRRDEKN